MVTLASDGTRMPVGALGRETACVELPMPTLLTCIWEVLFPDNPTLVLLTELPSVSVANLSAQFHPTEASTGTSETALQL